MSAPWPTLQVAPNVDRPPWNWNPTQTFIDAYNTQRITDQKTEEMRMSNELEKILFPLKVQNAQLQLEKLIQDRDRTMLLNEQLRESRRNASSGINAAISGVDQSSSGDFGPFTRSVGSTTTPPAVQSAPGRKLGENLQPKQP
jgi:hypothetical protein